MFTRKRFQHGSLTKEKRSSGADVWIFRWREHVACGAKVNRKVIVGSVEQYPTKTDAEHAAVGLRLDITKELPQRVKGTITVGELVAHYRETELSETKKRKAYSTRQCYVQYLESRILPRWKDYRLADVRTVAVEDWLGSIGLANSSKAKIRNIFHAVYNHAIRYEWFDRNPITMVRQSAKRQTTPDILNTSEIAKLVSELDEPFRTMVFLVAATGLRRSELFALKWRDIDFETQEIRLERAIVHQVVGELKTEASKKPVALDSELAKALGALRERSRYSSPNDWVFASQASGGTKPYWPDTVLDRHILPAAKRCGITKKIGWHTFRHTVASLAKANGEDVKVVQEMLRHANARITMDIYAQALTPAKREAQSKIVRMILPKQQGTLGPGR